jgi:predicted transcriptional regulator
MKLFNRRSRIVSIRLSDEEFLQLQRACFKKGARSLSDVTREALHQFVNGDERQANETKWGLDALVGRVKALEEKVAKVVAGGGNGR